jgi:hypothetical protein
VDGALVATVRPQDTSYRTYSTPSFAVAAGTHAIALRGRDTAGGDNTAFLDSVQVASA